MNRKEQETVKEILRGNSSKFAGIVDSYQQMVYTVALGFLQNKEDARDVTQEVFITVFTKLGKFRGESLLSTWIYRITINKCLEFVRKHRKSHNRELVSDLYLEEIKGEGREEVLKNLMSRENLQLFADALNSIPARQKTAFILSRYRDMSQKEVAEVMRIGEKAVESLLQRAKKGITRYLDKKRD